MNRYPLGSIINALNNQKQDVKDIAALISDAAEKVNSASPAAAIQEVSKMDELKKLAELKEEKHMNPD